MDRVQTIDAANLTDAAQATRRLSVSKVNKPLNTDKVFEWLPSCSIQRYFTKQCAIWSFEEIWLIAAGKI